MFKFPKTQPLGPLMVDVSGLFLSAEDKDFLCHPAIGAVILFSRNYQSKRQLRALVEEIKLLRNPQLLIAVDQEGGRVQRFRQDFYSLPSLYKIGQSYDLNPDRTKQLSYAAGFVMANELAEVAIDFSFSPVLDLADLNSQVIGDRGFHFEPAITVDLASSYIKGMRAVGMAATGKHFPGHGGVLEDSHVALPIDKRTRDVLFGRDLIPFARMSKHLNGMMTAHVLFPEIHYDLPTYSHFWLNQILRNELLFKGVIFSDDLTMVGAINVGTISNRVERALGAGCNMVLICNDREASIEVIENVTFNFENAVSFEALRLKKTTIPEQKLRKMKRLLECIG